MALDPHTATLAVLTLGVGWLMAAAGLQKNALELRRRRRALPVVRPADRRRASAPAASKPASPASSSGAARRCAAARRSSASASSSAASPSSRTIVFRSAEPFFRQRMASRRTAALPSAVASVCSSGAHAVDRARMVAREQLEREQRRAAARRALVVEPAPQQLFLRAPAELADRAERDGALAEVGAARGALEIVGPLRAEIGELALGAALRELVALRRRLRERHACTCACLA